MKPLATHRQRRNNGSHMQSNVLKIQFFFCFSLLFQWIHRWQHPSTNGLSIFFRSQNDYTKHCHNHLTLVFSLFILFLVHHFLTMPMCIIIKSYFKRMGRSEMVEKNAEIWTGKGKLLLSDIQFPGIKLATAATAEKN